MSKTSPKQRYEQLKEWLAVFNKGKKPVRKNKFNKKRRYD